MKCLTRLLAHPLTRGLSLDAAATTELRRRIIREKGFLRRLYGEWYGKIAAEIPAGTGEVMELGSGAGFIKDVIPEVITTDVHGWTGIDRVFSATEAWPFGNGSLRAVVMVDVLHHISRPRVLFSEAIRTVATGGRLVLIEPWNTPWSSRVYRHLHHEPFLPDASSWEFPESGPLSGANGALPWILFERDRVLFEREFPEWKILRSEVMMPLVYLLSGGVSMRGFLPGWAYPLCRAAERCLESGSRRCGMFALIVLEKRER